MLVLRLIGPLVLVSKLVKDTVSDSSSPLIEYETRSALLLFCSAMGGFEKPTLRPCLKLQVADLVIGTLLMG